MSNLTSTIKSIRDIMHKNAGVNRDPKYVFELNKQQRMVTKVQQLQQQLNQLEAQVEQSRQYTSSCCNCIKSSF